MDDKDRIWKLERRMDRFDKRLDRIETRIQVIGDTVNYLVKVLDNIMKKQGSLFELDTDTSKAV